MSTTAAILAELCTLMCLIPKLGRIHRPGIPEEPKFPEEHMLLAHVLRGKKWMEDFSFSPPVTQFIKCDQEGECTELGDEKSVSGRSFRFACCSPAITALYELTLQWGGQKKKQDWFLQQNQNKNPRIHSAAWQLWAPHSCSPLASLPRRATDCPWAEVWRVRSLPLLGWMLQQLDCSIKQSGTKSVLAPVIEEVVSNSDHNGEFVRERGFQTCLGFSVCHRGVCQPVAKGS